MLQLPYEQIIAKIKDSGKLSDQEIESKIQEKMRQLSDLISKEGAAHIVANELGIKLFEHVSGRVQLKNILAGMRNVELVAKVQRMFDVREFQSEKRSGKVGSFIVGDETGTMRIVAWGSQTDHFSHLKEGDVVKILSGYAKDNNGQREVHLNDKSELKINPDGESVGDIKPQETVRKQIKELREGDQQVEVLGTVVQAFEPRFFEVDPSTGRRLRPNPDNKYIDAAGKEVVPDYSYVLNAVLDDGTETIRGVFFREQLEALTGKKREDMLAIRENAEELEKLKNDLLGTQVTVEGKITKNQMFDRMELMARSVNPKPDPSKELARLKAKKDDSSPAVEEVI